MKTIMIFFRAFGSLSFGKILKLCHAVLPHPIFSILAFYATVRSFRVAKKHFPKTHSGVGVGNAFRHALWCCLIMMYCCKVSSPQKALKFCKNITNLHEELFPNETPERKMDLHNNRVGMELFMTMLDGIHRQFFETSFFVEKLLPMTNNAQILGKGDLSPERLLYLEQPSV